VPPPRPHSGQRVCVPWGCWPGTDAVDGAGKKGMRPPCLPIMGIYSGGALAGRSVDTGPICCKALHVERHGAGDAVDGEITADQEVGG
jgi:hypothetical protein